MKILLREVTRFTGTTCNWPPLEAAEFIAWFQEKLESIPIGRQGSAMIEISASVDEEGDVYPIIDISYSRQETDEEEQSRERGLAIHAQLKEQDERRLLKELLAKYGNPQS